MAVSPFRTFVSGEILTASDLNSSFGQVFDNGEDLGWPATKTKDLDGQKLVLDSDADTSIHASTDDQIDFEAGGFDVLRVVGASSAVNGVNITASATGNDVAIAARGSDTDVDLDLQSQGAGVVRVNGTAISTSGFADPMTTRGDIIVRDASNDTERLAVGGASEVLSSDGTDVVWASLTSLGALENVSEDTTPQLGGALDGQNNTIDNVKAVVDARTSTSETTTNADSGQVITLTNGSAITFTVHAAAPAGFCCTIIQGGAGQVTVAAGGTGNVRNFNGHTKLAGQYASAVIIVRSNAGTAPEVYLAGTTAP